MKVKFWFGREFEKIINDKIVITLYFTPVRPVEIIKVDFKLCPYEMPKSKMMDDKDGRKNPTE